MANIIHPAIQEELDMLRERFPGKVELTLDDYADYFGISRHYASQHLSRTNAGGIKIDHKRMGRKILIPFIDFAQYLARCKVVNGAPLMLPTSEQRKANKSRGGFSSTPSYDYPSRS